MPSVVNPLDTELQQKLLKAMECGQRMVVIYWIDDVIEDGKPQRKLFMYRQTREGFPQPDFNGCLAMLQKDLQEETEKLVSGTLTSRSA